MDTYEADMNRHNTPALIELTHLTVPVAELVAAHNQLKHRSNDEQFYQYSDIKSNVADAFPIKTGQYGYVGITDIAEDQKALWNRASPREMYKMVARGEAPALDDRNYTVMREDVPESVRAFLGQFRGTISRTRFAVLGAHSSIKEHVDNDINHTIRIHVPLISSKYCVSGFRTMPNVYEHYVMEVGKAYFFNAAIPHYVINGGDEYRLHLIVNLNTHEDLNGYGCHI